MSRTPEVVARWKKETYPAIAAAAQQEGPTVYFADETGICSDYHADTTWAPIGQTPVVNNTGQRYAVNMFSAMTAKGAAVRRLRGHHQRRHLHRLLQTPAA
jgi:DDE superfamily endonuclease